MGNSTANIVITRVDAQDVTRIEQLGSAADIWYGNIMALIKLRESGTTMVSILPKDSVFRCILEYQSPRFLCWRYSDPYMPLQGTQDRHFPAIENLDYDNYIVALDQCSKFE